jgi:hypothetical protein
MELTYGIAIAFVIYIIYVNLKKKSGESEKPLNNLENMPYKSKYLLSPNEYNFYKELKIYADENNLLICPKVGLKDLFEVSKGTKNYTTYFNKINRKHIDFLVCDNNLKPKYAIELDDKSHEKEKNMENDKFKNAIFTQANIRLIRIKALQQYSREYIEKSINLAAVPEVKITEKSLISVDSNGI